MPATIRSIYRGQPKVLGDARGEWVSSIARERVDGSVEVLGEGLAGDAVAQPYHGGPDAALCVHLEEHYRFWRERHGVNLRLGGLGENLVLSGIREEEVFAGDVVQVGAARLQVSGPRVPCANQGRHVGREDWVKLTVRESRTGFYVRVLEPGVIRAGDAWQLERRTNETGSITAIHRCFYLAFDAELARGIVAIEGLGEWWKEQFREKLGGRADHWSVGMKDLGGTILAGMSTMPPNTPVSYSYSAQPVPQVVVIRDIDMSIGAMCRFLVKWVIASIPAFIILWVMFFVIFALLAAMFGAPTFFHPHRPTPF